VPQGTAVPRPAVNPIEITGADGRIESLVLPGAHYTSRAFAGSGRIGAEGDALAIDARLSSRADLSVQWQLPDGSLPAEWLDGEVSVSVCGVAEGFAWQVTGSTGAVAAPPMPEFGSAPPAPPEASQGAADGHAPECWQLPPAASGDTGITATVMAGSSLLVDRIEYRPHDED
jgi:hypothetical protein